MPANSKPVGGQFANVPWPLTFEDEFGAGGLDAAKWHSSFPGSATEPNGPTNFDVSGGSLRIWPMPIYTGRTINTKDKFSQKYGYFEIRAKLMHGIGPSAAFYLLADGYPTLNNELTLLSAFTNSHPFYSSIDNRPTNFETLLYGKDGGLDFLGSLNLQGATGLAPILSNAFYTYGALWEPDGVTIFFDGQQVGSKMFTTGLNVPMFLNIAMYYGSASGNPGVGTVTGPGNAYEIDYVRVWTLNPPVVTPVPGDPVTTKYIDEVTIYKLRGGTSTLTAILSNQHHTIPADTDGRVVSFIGASCFMQIFEGSSEKTLDWTFSTANSSGVTSALNNATVTITGMTQDTGYVDITAAKAGQPPITKRFVVVKSRSAISLAGARGTVTIGATVNVVGWADSAARQAISDAGYGEPVAGDRVTLYNSTLNFAETRVFRGGSWVTEGANINGSQIVPGTLQGTSLTGPVHGYGSSAAASVRGRNTANNAEGLIGTNSGYDFYANGAGINYGPFTGAHDALVPLGADIAEGDIVVDVKCIARRGLSNTIFEVARCEAENEPGALGVVVKIIGPLRDYSPAVFRGTPTEILDKDGKSIVVQNDNGFSAVADQYRLVAVNALGEGQINVCGRGGDLAKGDLIVTASLPGKGMRQIDDIVRSYTVARAREAVLFSHPDDVKTVACIYLGG